MTVFVDASALIAMIAGEPDASLLADALDGEPDRLCSAIAAWEAVAGLRQGHDLAIDTARAQLRSFLGTTHIRLVDVGQREFEIAADAYSRFGKGRHPAALNMADCFAYACTKANAAKLLFKGDDFGRTDIAVAGAGRARCPGPPRSAGRR